MSEFRCAVRYKDGTKNVIDVSKVSDHLECRKFLEEQTTAMTILIGIDGGKPEVKERA
jgi:hypothetical protein